MPLTRTATALLALSLSLSLSLLPLTARPAMAAWTQEIRAAVLETGRLPRRLDTTLLVTEYMAAPGARLCVLASTHPEVEGVEVRFRADVFRRASGGIPDVSRLRSRRLPLVEGSARDCLPVGVVVAGNWIEIRARFYNRPRGDRPGLRVDTAATLEPLFDTQSSVALAGLEKPLGSDLVRREESVKVTIDYVCAERGGCVVWLEAKGPYLESVSGFGAGGQRVLRGSGSVDDSLQCSVAGRDAEFLVVSIRRRNGDVVVEEVIAGGYRCVDP